MKIVSKLTFGLVSVIGMVGCGSSGLGEVAEEETVGEQTAALTYNARVANGTRHDFNGDQIEDILVAGPYGTDVLLGMVGGGFGFGAWHRSDLVQNAVQYVVGDFNGDHRSDLIITTAGGSYQYFGADSWGNFTAGSWVRGDLTLGNVDYTVGDFNRDGRSDLMVATPNGTEQYLGRASRGFDSYWSSAVTKARVELTPGDFNGDGATDLIFTVSDGSYLYTGSAGPRGGFTSNVWVRGDYPLHEVEFYVGNFNGVNVDGRSCDDVIAKTLVDSRQLLGVANGGFNPPIWKHPEFSLVNNVQFLPGDFNGDGKTDLILSQGNGTSLLLGQSGGGFGSSSWSRSDVDSYHSSFVRGDYSKDGRDDLLIMLGTDPKNAPGTSEYLGQPNGAQPRGFTNSVFYNPNMVLSGGWAIY